ncbi:MAG: peptide chain release factor 2 [Clostridia bacterium]
MDLDSLKEKLNILKSDITRLSSACNILEKQNKIKLLEDKTCEPDFYSLESSTSVLQEIKNLNIEVKKMHNICNMLEDAEAYLELASSENDLESFKETEKLINILAEKADKLEIEALLSNEYDSHNAILSIHPGAGGTESQDWAEMLYRMYCKWAVKSEYEVEILDMQIGDEAGIKSVSIMIKGLNSYGYLKSEKGVHRLVRISPFDSNSRRHTSFAAVEIMPEITDDMNLEIKSEDLDVGTFRSSGAGGQNVNKVESAVRIKHIPTGIVVSCQTERSQLQNKENCMKMLKSKIYEYEKIKEAEKKAGIKGESLDIAWGSQIRSYVFCPYTLVKDHRTNYEEGNIQGVMDGKLDEFMYEYLKYIKVGGII